MFLFLLCPRAAQVAESPEYILPTGVVGVCQPIQQRNRYAAHTSARRWTTGTDSVIAC
jgi:hypothetical protein